MEIEKIRKQYNKYSPEDFYNWASDNKIMELRLLNDRFGNKFSNWDLIKIIGQKLNLDTRFNSIYISKFLHLRQILLYRYSDLPLTKYYNIFMSINPKRKVYVKNKNGLLNKSYFGGIAGTSYIQNILCDIEHQGIREKSASAQELEECIQGAKFLVTFLELTNYYINISGNGVHLWIKMEEPIEVPIPNFIEYPDKLKYNLKEEPIYSVIKRYNRFIEMLNKAIQEFNPKLKVDEGAKDFSRIARPVGSWNVKVRKTERAVGTVDSKCKIYNIIKPKYMAVCLQLNNVNRKVLERASLTNKHRYNLLNIGDSPISKFLLSGLLPSTLSRNHYLEQSFARLLRDNEIKPEEISMLINKIDIIQRKSIQVDPTYLGDEESFNSETINSYCYGCRLDFIYPILEDLPEITEGNIDLEHYNNLNSFSWETVSKMKVNIEKQITSYLDIKYIVRKMLDKYERSVIFFSLKYHLENDWDYIHKNLIIQQILNKTRVLK